MAHNNTALDTYRSILGRHLGRGFALHELVVAGDRRRMLPPATLMSRMVPTLELANELRRRCVDEGISGLRIRAAYRPAGGASRSRHKLNAALDLDLLRPDYDRARDYYRIAARLWSELGAELDAGLGLYVRAGGLGGIRVHLDTEARKRATTWQMSGGAYVNPPLALRLLRELELEVPR